MALVGNKVPDQSVFHVVLLLQMRGSIHIIFHLFLHGKISGYSLEAPQQHTLSCKSKKTTTTFQLKKPLIWIYESNLGLHCPLFVLRFYGPINLLGSCRARSVYLTTRLLGRLSPLSG